MCTLSSNFIRRFLALLFVNSLLVIAPPTVAVSSCNSEGMKFQQLALSAGSKEDYKEAARWLDKAVALCPVYKNYHLLGRAEQKLGNYDKALTAYNKAQEVAEDRDAQALSIGRYGQVATLKGYRGEALTLLQEARRIHRNAPGWLTDLTKELDKSIAESPLQKDDIVRGLSATSSTGLLTVADIKRVDSANKIKQSIDIRINFISDSVAMDNRSQEELPILAAALADGKLSGKTFWLIGHTDTRGSDEYNDLLSEKRAEAIYSMLVGLDSDLEDRLKTKGMGERNPLYTDDNTEKTHRLNRRLQVVIE